MLAPKPIAVCVYCSNPVLPRRGRRSAKPYCSGRKCASKARRERWRGASQRYRRKKASDPAFLERQKAQRFLRRRRIHPGNLIFIARPARPRVRDENLINHLLFTWQAAWDGQAAVARSGAKLLLHDLKDRQDDFGRHLRLYALEALRDTEPPQGKLWLTRDVVGGWRDEGELLPLMKALLYAGFIYYRLQAPKQALLYFKAVDYLSESHKSDPRVLRLCAHSLFLTSRVKAMYLNDLPGAKHALDALDSVAQQLGRPLVAASCHRERSVLLVTEAGTEAKTSKWVLFDKAEKELRRAEEEFNKVSHIPDGLLLAIAREAVQLELARGCKDKANELVQLAVIPLLQRYPSGFRFDWLRDLKSKHGLDFELPQGLRLNWLTIIPEVHDVWADL